MTAEWINNGLWTKNKNKFKELIEININERKDNIINIIDSINLVTNDGEIINLHDDIKESIAKTIIKSEAEQTTKEIQKKEEYKKYISAKTDFQNCINENFGSFYFNFYNSITPTLERQYKFRFIYLCTYLKYNDNRLMYKQQNGLYKLYKENNLMELLRLSERETRNTKKALIENGLIKIDADKNIIINDRISFLGELTKGDKRAYTRIFKDAIQELYNNSLPREHKLLGLLIDLLPLINFKFNIICYNPNCELVEDLQPLSLKDISEYFKLYTGKNITSLKNKLLKIKVNKQDAIMYMERDGMKAFVVNPSIYYKGNNINDLNYLIDLFRI